MAKKWMRVLALGCSAGVLLQFGGCLGGALNPRTLLTTGLVYTGLEFVLDNDAVFDLFPDGDAPTVNSGG